MVWLVVLLCGSISMARADCYIMGDSIAQGVAMNRKDCSSETQVGLNTKKAVQFWTNKGIIIKDKVIISLGVNDGNINTENNLSIIRDNIKAKQVIWILPPNKEKSILVKNIASNYGDYVLNITSQLGKDNIHPTGKGYIKIAQHIKNFQYEYNTNNMNTTAMNNKENNINSNPIEKYQYTRDYIQN